jgi:DNA repair photolyase
VAASPQFTPSPSPSRLIGIARLAASGDLLDSKKVVEYRTLPSRKWLNRCHSDRVPFDWTINPYRGCEYACRYCYARFTHEFLERRGPAAFETEIFAKVWDPNSFLRELRQVTPGQTIAIGTATDPYQPAERRYESTRGVLEALRCLRGVHITITSKSDLVARDAQLLSELARNNQVHVTLSVTTLNASLARLTEPKAPRPDLRLRAVATLRESGVRAGVIASPVLPCLTDSRQSLTAVARAAKSVDACHFGAGLLFLQGETKVTYFAFLQQHFPALVARYRAAYSKEVRLTSPYAERLRQMVEGIRQEVGISGVDLYYPRMVADAPPQLGLFDPVPAAAGD